MPWEHYRSPTVGLGEQLRAALLGDDLVELAGHVSTSAPDLLERSEELAALAGELAAVADTEAGRLTLVAGEAGIGKSALVRAFCG